MTVYVLLATPDAAVRSPAGEKVSDHCTASADSNLPVETNAAPPYSHRYRRQLELLGRVVVLQRRNEDQESAVQQPGSQTRWNGVPRTAARVHRLLLNPSEGARVCVLTGLKLNYVNEIFKELNFY